MPALQRYKIHHQRDIIHEVTGLNMVECWRSQISRADPSTTRAPILDLIEGGCWGRRQLWNRIKEVSMALILTRLLTLVRVVFIERLAIAELDSRLLRNPCSGLGSDCRGLLGSTPATQWYKVRPCRIETHEIAVFCTGYMMYQAGDILLDGSYLHK